MTDADIKQAKDWVTANTGFNPKEPLGKIAIRIFLAGLKAGRPKWHKVADGDLPTHSYRVLVYTDEGVGFGLYGLDDKKWHTYDTGFDVIAWKGIVLPKLPKESE